VELATRPEVLERMIAEFGVAHTYQVLMALKAQAEHWIATADEFDLEDRRISPQGLPGDRPRR
jgi:hypothetical protein